MKEEARFGGERIRTSGKAFGFLGRAICSNHISFFVVVVLR